MLSDKEIKEYLNTRMFEKENERVMEHWDMITGNKNFSAEGRAFLTKIYRLGYADAVIDTTSIIEEVEKYVNNGGN